MTMLTSGTQLQSIGASFAVHYYTTLVKAPEALAALYIPSAHVVHRYKKANGTAELSSLLTSLTSEGVAEVKLDDVTSTPTTSGAIKVVVKGQFVRNASTHPFTQEVELRELERNTYGITSDKLSYAADEKAARSAVKPLLKAAAQLKVIAPVDPVDTEEETTTDAPGPSAKGADARESASLASAADVAAATPAPAEEAAASVPAAIKKPASFAEALRLQKVGGGAAFSNIAVRVTDKSGVTKDKKATVKSAKAGKESKKVASPSAVALTPKLAKKPHRASDSLIYYDIILKELPESMTEEQVRAMVSPVADVKLVNLVRNEKRRRSKEAAPETIAFAFVQLERPADATASLVKDVVAKLAKLNKDIRIEEVREKKPASARLRKPREGAVSSLKKVKA
ncbi:hypothetical protein LSCM1_06675 [Leishmania martiniquensis]|uniref:NTF2 domain-containing protein n=1 Tax=Leishmania martiniquensis TaxID=1580590 RepID=A0A836HQD6_9TRYP|nr:hypothetical protein LSCM1_06675 [Leishmania martiniquensis]